MKAVNLIPEDERRGAGGTAGRSGGAAYVLVGGLAVVVLMLFAYLTTSRSINDERATLATASAQAVAAEAQTATLQPYTAFRTLRTSRVETVRSIAQSRFDWAHAMHEVARVLPRNITLTSLNGTVSPSAGSVVVPLRSTYNVPALEFVGCATGQAAIPPMLASLRRIDGVRRVALQQSTTDASSSPGAATPVTGTGAAPAATQRKPNCARTFQAVVFFDPVTAPAAAAATPPAAGTAQAAAAPGTTPSSTTGAAK